MGLNQRLASVGLFIVLCLLHGDRQFPPEQLIHPGERHRDLLGNFDPLRAKPPRGPERHWAFDGHAGQRITISAESYEFDTYLLLLDPQRQQLAWSDNNGWFFNARIRATLPWTGRYKVVVCGANADQNGTYWLSLEEGDHQVDWNESTIAAYYRHGIEWAEREANGRAVSWLNLAMGQYCRERRRWQRAEEYYAKSLAAAEQAGFLYGQWAVALERGTLLTERKRYDQAVGELQRALDLGKELRASDQAEAAVLTQLGDLYRYTGRPDLAGVYYRNASQRAEQSGLPSALVRLYTSLFKFLLLKDKEKAVNYAQKAYALRQGLDPVLELSVTDTLARAYLMSGRSQEGSKLAIETRRIAHLLSCRDKEISILNLMSMAYYRLNNIEEMIRSAREAAELTSPDNEDLNPRRTALQLQAKGEMLRGNYETALRLCLNALQTTEDAWAREPIEEPRQELLSQSKAICTQIIRNLNALNARHPSSEYARQAFDFAERSRCRALLDQLASPSTGFQSVIDAQLLEQERGLLEQISAMGRQIVLVRALANVDPVSLDQLEEERARLIGKRMQLEAETRRLAANRDAARLSPLTAEQVQREFLAAHPHAAILFYQLGIQESFLIVLMRERGHLFKLPDWTIISNAVAEWRAQIRRQLNPAERTSEAFRDYARIAHRLYDMLIKPAADVIRGRELIVVPDGALNNLAFEALVVNELSSEPTYGRPNYVVEHHTVTYAPSVSVLAEIECGGNRTRAGNEMLLVGDAVFNDSDPRIAQTKQQGTSQGAATEMAYSQRLRAGLHRLPSTGEEVVEIASLAEHHRWRPTVWLGFEANEENFKGRNLPSYRVVHLATHAVADDQDGSFSAFVLSQGEKKAGEDGVLTAAEIARLRFNADLVVLSGCETSTGQKTPAEGIIGLSRAFIVAGAQRVCGSLWKVEDTSTQKLMVAFYEGLLAEGFSTPRALQQAKMRLLHSGAAPFYWAPFILVGSPR
ncbi:MAG: CHAT domain-containing protein [Acidobacteria bacterium]|nr:CHAT domain-containing protein [Acidobacteriota bacterium]